MCDDGKNENINKIMRAGTPAETPADTPTDTPDDNEYIPPCRQAEVFITACPRCGREMRLQTLRYSHVCGRSFDPAERARKQQVLAGNAIKVRMASIKKPLERHVQHITEHTHTTKR